MDRIDGPQVKFERVVMNFSEADICVKNKDQSYQNTYRDGDILNEESDVDLKPGLVSMSIEQLSSRQGYEQNANYSKGISLSIFNNNNNFRLQSFTADNKDDSFIQTPRNIGGDNIQVLLHNLQRNKYDAQSPQSKLGDTNYSYRKKAAKEYKDLLIDSSHTNYIAKKMNPKAEKNLPQIFDVKLVNQIKRKIIYFSRMFTNAGKQQYLNNKSIRRIIGDKSDIFQINGGNCLSKFLCCMYSQFDNTTLKSNYENYLFNPYSPATFWMKFAFTTYNVIFFIGQSIAVIYIQGDVQDNFIYRITQLVWVIEFLVQINTQIYDSFNLISDRHQIFSHYMKKKATFDILPFLILVVFPDNQIQRITFQCVSFLKMNNVYNDINEIQKKLCMLVKNYYVIQLSNLILKLLIIGHIIACMWYLIGQVELRLLGAETTWYEQSLSVKQTWQVLYLESFYWALTLMTTGSNVATSIIQMLFTTIIMLFTTILFGYMLNVTGIIISQLDKQDENKRLDLNILNEYMRNNRISKTLQARVNIDLEYYYMNNMDKIQEDKSVVLNKISPNLQNLLKQEYSNQIIQQIDFVRQKFSSETISELSNWLIEEFYLPNQNIFYQNQHEKICLIFVLQGQIELSQSVDNSSKKIPIKLIKKGDLIGQANFFTGLAYDRSARSTKFTKIVKIERDKFIEIIQNRKQDKEIFCQMRDTVLLYNNFDVVKDSCSFCSNTIHVEKDCPLVHTAKSQLYYKNKFYQNQTQIRGLTSRKQYSTSNALHQRKEVCFITKQYWKNLKSELRENKDDQFKLSYLMNRIDLEEQSSDNDENEDNSHTIKSNHFKSENIIQEEDLQEELLKQSRRKSKRANTCINEPLNQKLQNSFVNFNNNNNTINSNNNGINNKNNGTNNNVNINNINNSIINNSINNKFMSNSNKCIMLSQMNFDTNIDLLPQMNDCNDQKVLSQMFTVSQRKKRFSILQKQAKQIPSDDDSNMKKSNISKQHSNMNGNQSDHDQKSEIYQNGTFDTTNTKQFNQCTTSQNNIKNIPPNLFRNEVDTNSIFFQNIDENLLQLNRDIKGCKQLDLLNPWSFDKLKDYTRYFPSGNSKLILIKILKFQRKRQKPQKKQKYVLNK